MSTVDVEATALSELSTFGTAGKISGAALSKITTPLSVAVSLETCILYDSLIYSENVQGWIDSGSLGDTRLQKLALIREQDSKIFDETAKSHINLACNIGGLVTAGLIGAAGFVGAPIAITATAFCAASFALGWAYDNFVAKKLNDEANNFHNELSNNFNNIVDDEEENKSDEDTLPGDDTKSDDEKPAGRLKSAIESGNNYGKLNYEKYVAPHYYYVEVHSTGYYISNDSWNYVMYKEENVWHSTGETVSGSGANLQGSSGNDFVENNADKVKINTGADDDAVHNSGDSVTIDTGAGNDFVGTNGTKHFVDLGDGNDVAENSGDDTTISGGKGNDTLTGGKGKDLFVFNGGNDVITDYSAGDRILIDADVISSTLNGSDAVFIVGKNTLTVKDVGRSELTLVDAEGSELTTIIGSVIYDDEYNSKVTLASGIEIGDASERTMAINVVGNALDNTIIGSLKNDTLYGAKGNDTLYGGDGADNFIYSKGDGKDIISGFDSKDTLTFDNLAFTTSYNKSKGTITLNVNGGSVTLKDFSTKTFHINNDTYKISGSTLKKQ